MNIQLIPTLNIQNDEKYEEVETNYIKAFRKLKKPSLKLMLEK